MLESDHSLQAKICFRNLTSSLTLSLLVPLKKNLGTPRLHSLFAAVSQIVPSQKNAFSKTPIFLRRHLLFLNIAPCSNFLLSFSDHTLYNNSLAGRCLREGAEEGALLKLGLLSKGNEEGCAEKLCDPDGEVEGPLGGWDEGPEECALLKIGLLKATNKRARLKQSSNPDGEVEGPTAR